MQGLLAMRRDVPVVLDVGVHRGSEEALRAFAASDTLKAMTRDYEARFGGAEGRVRLTYRQVFP